MSKESYKQNWECQCCGKKATFRVTKKPTMEVQTGTCKECRSDAFGFEEPTNKPVFGGTTEYCKERQVRDRSVGEGDDLALGFQMMGDDYEG